MDDRMVQRFLAKVERRGPDDCWPWTASVDRRGYGKFGAGGRTLGAHRVAYAIANGEPGALHVLHRCDNPRCCNPAHLFLGTHADNVRDMDAKGRRVNGGACAPGARPRFSSRRGGKNSRARLTEMDVVRMLMKRRSGALLREIADEFGISVQQCWRITEGKSWSHVGHR